MYDEIQQRNINNLFIKIMKEVCYLEMSYYLEREKYWLKLLYRSRI